jgi:mannosyl-oligosaccharide glucosidase
MPMNYLTLGALYKTYGAQDGPYKDLARKVYVELRKNIVDNVFKVATRSLPLCLVPGL